MSCRITMGRKQRRSPLGPFPKKRYLIPRPSDALQTHMTTCPDRVWKASAGQCCPGERSRPESDTCSCAPTSVERQRLKSTARSQQLSCVLGPNGLAAGVTMEQRAPPPPNTRSRDQPQQGAHGFRRVHTPRLERRACSLACTRVGTPADGPNSCEGAPAPRHERSPPHCKKCLPQLLRRKTAESRSGVFL